MDFVEGGNLRDFLVIRKKLEATEALRLLEETANGLAYAYGQGLTHRDLKPTNILIAANQTAKLVDFGLAELVGIHRDEGGENDRTVQYAGLERATNTKPGDLRSDVYFLGCTFFEMVTGRPLLVVSRADRTRLSRDRFELEGLLHRDDPDLPPPIFSLITRMVAFDPARRFQGYDQLLEAIQQVRGVVRRGSGRAQRRRSEDRLCRGAQCQVPGRVSREAQTQGYRVLISINASQAVSRFGQQPFDALIVNCATGDRGDLEAFERVMQEAELKRLDCAGLLIVSPDQEHWAESIQAFPKSASLTMPVGMRQIVQKLTELV